MFNILVVEDNDSIRKLISAYLERDGYKAFPATDGEDALEVLEREHIDLMICDIMMPKMDGYQLTEELRDADYTLPILMITAKERIEDKKRAFKIGTDDYMVKPIDFDEMLLRVEALLRRAKIAFEKKIVIGDIIVDYGALSVTKNGEIIDLPAKEFYLLFELLSYPKKIFTRQELMDKIWGFETETDPRTVDVHIKRLREKFDNYEEFTIQTVRGLGYRAIR